MFSMTDQMASTAFLAVSIAWPHFDMSFTKASRRASDLSRIGRRLHKKNIQSQIAEKQHVCIATAQIVEQEKGRPHMVGAKLIVVAGDLQEMGIGSDHCLRLNIKYFNY